jgi:hypothetical protein
MLQIPGDVLTFISAISFLITVFLVQPGVFRQIPPSVSVLCINHVGNPL